MERRIKAAIGIVKESLAQQLPITALAKRVNLSPTRLRQLFKKETGRTPLQYIRDLRMEHAKQLLQNTFLSVKQIAFSSGANDVSGFVRDFKKQYGLTPGAFRAGRQPRKKDAMNVG